MSKRLQVLLKEPEYREIRQAARARNLSVAEWVRQERPNFDWREYGFQEFSELLNYAQDKGLVRNQVDEEKGLIVYLGAEFHPPAAPPEPEPVPQMDEEEVDEPQPLVPGQPTATGEIPLPELPPKPQRRPRAPRKTSAGSDGNVKKRTSRPPCISRSTRATCDRSPAGAAGRSRREVPRARFTGRNDARRGVESRTD